MKFPLYLTIILSLAISFSAATQQNPAIPLHPVYPADDNGTAEAEHAARQVVDEFFVAWNNADNPAIHKAINFPHVFLVNNGRMAIANGPDELITDFDRMRKDSDWHSSSLDSIEITRSSPDKVHFEIVFSRRHKDGTAYRTVPALWIVTKQDGHWGIQIRSIMSNIDLAPKV